jgi:hypothetical protein
MARLSWSPNAGVIASWSNTEAGDHCAPAMLEFYQALQYEGVPTVMIRFQGEWHGTTSKPSNFLRTQLYLRKWFERWGTHDDGRAVTDLDR